MPSGLNYAPAAKFVDGTIQAAAPAEYGDDSPSQLYNKSGKLCPLCWIEGTITNIDPEWCVCGRHWREWRELVRYPDLFALALKELMIEVLIARDFDDGDDDPGKQLVIWRKRGGPDRLGRPKKEQVSEE
jgi:hypothetical protein